MKKTDWSRVNAILGKTHPSKPTIFYVSEDRIANTHSMFVAALAPHAILPGDWPAETDADRAADACWRLQHGERRKAMDAFTEQHLDAWLERAELAEFRQETKLEVMAFVAAHPEVLEGTTFTWTQIVELADRWARR